MGRRGLWGAGGESVGQGKVLGGVKPPPTDPGPRNFQRLLPGRERVEKEPESGKAIGGGTKKGGGGTDTIWGGGTQVGGGRDKGVPGEGADTHMGVPPLWRGGMEGGMDGVPVTPGGGDHGGGVSPPSGGHRCHCHRCVCPCVCPSRPPPPPGAINSPRAACGGHRAKNSPGGTAAAGVCRGHPSTAQYTQLRWSSSSRCCIPPHLPVPVLSGLPVTAPSSPQLRSQGISQYLPVPASTLFPVPASPLLPVANSQQTPVTAPTQFPSPSCPSYCFPVSPSYSPTVPPSVSHFKPPSSHLPGPSSSPSCSSQIPSPLCLPVTTTGISQCSQYQLCSASQSEPGSIPW